MSLHIQFKNLLSIPEIQDSSQVSDSEKAITELYLDPENKSYLNISAPVYLPVEIDSDKTDISSINQQIIGYIQLGFSQDRMRLDGNSFILNTLLGVAVIILLGILLGLWFSRQITLPIERLALATKLFSKGK